MMSTSTAGDIKPPEGLPELPKVLLAVANTVETDGSDDVFTPQDTQQVCFYL